MKINKLQNNLNIYKQNGNSVKKKNENLKEKSFVNIEISSTTKNLVDGINGTAKSNYSEKVESIRKSIIENKYKVEPEKIAEKIIGTILSEKGSAI